MQRKGSNSTSGRKASKRLHILMMAAVGMGTICSIAFMSGRESTGPVVETLSSLRERFAASLDSGPNVTKVYRASDLDRVVERKVAPPPKPIDPARLADAEVRLTKDLASLQELHRQRAARLQAAASVPQKRKASPSSPHSN